MNTLLNPTTIELMEDKGFTDNLLHDGMGSSHYNVTISEAVMWLYEKHGIWVSVGLYVHLGNVSQFQFTIESQKSKSINSIVQLNINPFDSLKETYEAAILYTLNKLI